MYVSIPFCCSSVDSLIEKATDSKPTYNSITFLINNYENTYYGSLSEKNKDIIISAMDYFSKSTLVDRINETDKSCDGEKYYLICVSPSQSVWSYSYVTAIPYKDIYMSVMQNLSLSILFCVILLLSCFFITYLTTKMLYVSLGKTISIIAPNESDVQDNRDVFVRLNDSVSRMISKNAELKQSMQTFLPFYQQKTIAKILNTATVSDTLRKDFEEIEFQYDNFISVAIKFNFSLKFFSNFNAEKLKNETFILFETILGEKYVSFILPSNDNTFYSILNVDSSTTQIDIINLLQNTVSCFKADSDYINIVYGVGEPCSGFVGLKKTHEIAIEALIKAESEQKIIIPSAESQFKHHSIMNEENKLTNILIAGNFKEAKKYIDSLVYNIPDTQIDAHVDTYILILNVLFKILSLKNIKHLFDDKNSSEVISEILKKPKKEIDEFLYLLLQEIEKSMQIYNSKININEVISYIENHFGEDIYLDQLAKIFHTSTKYLSKRIKQHINIGFKDFLIKLRMDHAKELLSVTDMPISEISTKCGIPNRSTFIKSFKKECGLTPTEYRNTAKGKKKL